MVWILFRFEIELGIRFLLIKLHCLFSVQKSSPISNSHRCLVFLCYCKLLDISDLCQHFTLVRIRVKYVTSLSQVTWFLCLDKIDLAVQLIVHLASHFYVHLCRWIGLQMQEALSGERCTSLLIYIMYILYRQTYDNVQ